jgi:hypothetical protein
MSSVPHELKPPAGDLQSMSPSDPGSGGHSPVFASAPRWWDNSLELGGVLLLAGTPDISPLGHPERISSISCACENIQGGVVHVEGFGLASFEQTLLVEVEDGGGGVVGSMPVIVDAPDLGQPGTFSVDISYTVSEAGPGRIVVRDVSPAFGGNTHLASVEVNLSP